MPKRNMPLPPQMVGMCNLIRCPSKQISFQLKNIVIINLENSNSSIISVPCVSSNVDHLVLADFYHRAIFAQKQYASGVGNFINVVIVAITSMSSRLHVNTITFLERLPFIFQAFPPHWIFIANFLFLLFLLLDILFYFKELLKCLFIFRNL